MLQRLVILDRDGVINYDSKEYIKSPDEWHSIKSSMEAIARLKKAGVNVAVATNQSGIGRGYYSHETLALIHQKMQMELAHLDANIDKIIYCPHHPSEACLCRKPEPGMLLQLGRYFQTTLAKVPFVGDKPSDVQAAQNAGAIPIYIGDKTALPENYQTIQAYAHLSQFVDEFLS